MSAGFRTQRAHSSGEPTSVAVPLHRTHEVWGIS
jgi:hypothetical protein